MFIWSHALFTVENSFEVQPIKRNMHVWRKDSGRFDPACMIPTYKYGYELLNVCGGFSYHEKFPVVHKWELQESAMLQYV